MGSAYKYYLPITLFILTGCDTPQDTVPNSSVAPDSDTAGDTVYTITGNIPMDFADTVGDTGDQPPDSQMEDLLAAHNTLRQSAIPTPDPPLTPLVWSAQLAADAATWAQNCVMDSDPTLGAKHQGENIVVWTQAGVHTADETVFGSTIATDANLYDYNLNQCDGQDASGCGEYLQVVWRTTTHLGCAVATCPDGIENFPEGREIWVCRYSPPGNWVGERPY